MALSAQQKVFVEEYLACWNATKAAEKANYSLPNKAGPRLIKTKSIQAEIQERLSEKVMNADEILVRLSEIGRFNAGDYIHVKTDHNTGIHHTFVDVEQMKKDGFGYMIKNVKRTREGDQVELHDQEKMWELLGKHHKLFTDRTESQSEVNVNVKIDGLDSLLDKVYGRSNNNEQTSP